MVLVVNPVSGRRRGEQIAEAAVPRLRSYGWTVEHAQGETLDEVRESTQSRLAGGADTVVVVGGDGAVHAVLDLLVEADATLALLPAGTGNDLARALGLPYRDVEACLDLLSGADERRIDLIRAGDRWVATVVASGFDSKVNERANAMTWPRGHLRYVLAVGAELRSFEPLTFSLDLSGPDGDRTVQAPAMLVAVGNGPSFGGGLRIAQGAELDDGLLDVCLIRPVSRALLVRTFPRLMKGTHVSMPQFERHRVRRLRLDAPGIVAYGDGERIGPLPVEIAVAPAALSVIAPPPGRAVLPS
ncbi:MAG: diacylglycerol kinase family protein [Aeromicrobium sp.]|uniref:diacylglycerol/lipid kinase family protein n=1 Tax=Aeromicrobium sp. TaxID=1871063 RepID=UPI0039E5A226